MIQIEEIPKDLETSPLMFGIKGRYMMFLLWGGSLTLLVMITLIIMFFFKRNFGLCFVIFMIGIIAVSLLYWYLWYKSKPEKYKNIEYNGDLISNRDLLKTLE